MIQIEIWKIIFFELYKIFPESSMHQVYSQINSLKNFEIFEEEKESN